MRTWIDFLLGLVVPVATSIFLVVSLVLRRPRRDDLSLRGGEGEGSQLDADAESAHQHQRELIAWDNQFTAETGKYIWPDGTVHAAPPMAKHMEPGAIIPLSDNERLRQQQLAMAAMLQNLGLQNSQFAQMQNMAQRPLSDLYSSNQQCLPSHYQQLDQSNLSGLGALGTPGLQLLEKLLGLSKNNKGGLS